MKYVVTPAQMAALDRSTIEQLGIPAAALMERAALAVADAVDALRPSGVVVVACGPGNNGGDGLAVARILRLRGREVRCFAPHREYQDAVQVQWDSAHRCGVPFCDGIDGFEQALQGAAVVVDAIFGNGFSRTPQGVWQEMIACINRSGLPVVAVDTPSGVDGATGHVPGQAVHADTTVTFQYAKVGQLLYPGRQHAGRLVVADIGIADGSALTGGPSLMAPWRALEADDCVLPPRRADSYKNTYGHVAVVAGSRGMEGAGALSARACLRCGAGLVSWLLPEGADAALRPPEAMALHLPSRQGALTMDAAAPLREALRGKAVAVVGPGLGRAQWTQDLLRHILSCIDIPMIVDADACFALGGYPQLLQGKRCVLTPHPGEMARLMGLPTAEVVADPLGTAQRCAARYGAVTVLKGATTVVASPEGPVSLNLTGNAGMATAGSGDVLTGIIAALAAQGETLYDAAAKGCWLHGRAGDLAAGRLGQTGMLSGDIIDSLPQAMRGGAAKD